MTGYTPLQKNGVTPPDRYSAGLMHRGRDALALSSAHAYAHTKGGGPMAKAKAKDFKRTKEYRDLKRTLEENLESRGLVEPVYQDMVRRYLSFREIEHSAEMDIAENGINIWDEKRGSWQVNPSVSTLNNASRQAAAIYRALGFEDEAKKSRSGLGEDDEL